MTKRRKKHNRLNRENNSFLDHKYLTVSIVLTIVALLIAAGNDEGKVYDFLSTCLPEGSQELIVPGSNYYGCFTDLMSELAAKYGQGELIPGSGMIQVGGFVHVDSSNPILPRLVSKHEDFLPGRFPDDRFGYDSTIIFYESQFLILVYNGRETAVYALGYDMHEREQDLERIKEFVKLLIDSGLPLGYKTLDESDARDWLEKLNLYGFQEVNKTYQNPQ